MLSHSLITVYQSEATPWKIKSIICDMLLLLRLDAFVDDTNLIHSNYSDANMQELIQIVQQNFVCGKDSSNQVVEP